MPSLTFNPAKHNAWRKPLDNSYRGLKTLLKSHRPYLNDTGCTVVFALPINDQYEVWVTSPAAWEQVGDNTCWSVELFDVWYGERIDGKDRKSRDDAWIKKTVEHFIVKGNKIAKEA